MKEYLFLSLEDIGFKSEFGFDTVAAISRSVAKRMFELLKPISSNERVIFSLFLSENLKTMFLRRWESNWIGIKTIQGSLWIF